MTDSNKKIIVSGAILIGITSLFSRLLGIYRDRLFSTTFGAGSGLDAYFAAFRIPDTIFNLIVVGAVSSAFIPLFTDFLVKKNPAGAFRLANNLINIMMLSLIAIAGIIFLIAPWLMPLLGPGMDQVTRDLTLNLTRLMLLSPVFFGISNIASGILNSYKKFFVYSLTPIVYNLAIIAGTIWLVPYWGIYGVALGVIIGSLFHWLIQIPSIMKLGYRYRPLIDWKDKALRRVLKLIAPRTLGLAVYQINLFVSTSIATTVALGAVSIYNFANNLQSLPYSVIGISLSTTAFPILSAAASAQDRREYVSTLSRTIRQIIFLIVPASILMLLLRAQIVRIILGAGQFDWEATILTASALGYFVISLFAQSLVPLLAKAFYAIQNTVIPMIVSIVSMAINIGLAFWLTESMGVAGIALAFSISSFINMIILLLVLHIKMGGLEDIRIITSTFKVMIASLVMTFVVQGISINHGNTVLNVIPGVKALVANLVDMQTFWGVFAQATVAVLAGVLVYVFSSWLLKTEEMDLVYSLSKRMFFGRRPKKHQVNLR